MPLPPLKAFSRWLLGTTVFALVLVAPSRAQEARRPALRAGSLPSDLQLDGVLDEDAWTAADAIGSLTMIDPVEGGPLTGHTAVRILVSAKEIVVGVILRDPDPAGIVSYSKARDSRLRGEDHVKIIFDTFLDERSGYIFAVNPSGARYDALPARQGEGENANWDAVWEAATAIDADGWSVEIRIPVQSLSFDPTLREWGFNVQRRLERLQEVSRWSSPGRDAKISQTSRAGRLTGLPGFNIGVGLTVRPAVVGGGGKLGIDEDVGGTFEPSLDVQQRIGANVIALGTVEDLRKQARADHEHLEDIFLELTGDTNLECLFDPLQTLTS